MAALVQELLGATTTRLRPFSDTPQLDAQVLLAHILEKPRTWLLAHTASIIDSVRAATLERLVRRLERGEPLPYVLGHWEFFGLDFDLTPDVLIPRPETELLVERGIAWLQASTGRRAVADIGTGSGCIALSLAVHVGDVHVVATDISAAALDVARRNARKLGVTPRVDFVECDILPQRRGAFASDHHFDLICSNLPYISTRKLYSLPVHEREPVLALDGGSDGLDPFRRLFKIVPDWMAEGGRILLETEATRGAAVLSLAYDAFTEAELRLHQDMIGRDRLLEIQLP
jgi:release factor glutamine methyltransferase